ncbi:hypothetical protein B0H16DRAFT_1747340 [Mycena metata]|uniref:Uncharacterized protein n=1 Tax=Mycena metata TaxID=1033252 RepID=A0AAD7GTX0_9AGAR|nr:hypothetical protein B0H16DRAFT_1747340 [Mycena metata]
MFCIVSVLLRIVGFDGDDYLIIHDECTEMVSVFRHSKDPVFLNYEDYNPRRTVETIFPSHRAPH